MCWWLRKTSPEQLRSGFNLELYLRILEIRRYGKGII